ncbi:alginate export family protein [Sphingosinithalassobacter portus]|uniref:alginate export family protein n=1 Tax=Stakelama portus TaxID=2676234 RepID=UPI000D6E2BF0|nr:alginate export family protein [Sphingosinithalassobacter portus]
MKRAAILAIAGCCCASSALAATPQAFGIQGQTFAASDSAKPSDPPAAAQQPGTVQNEATKAPVSPEATGGTPAAATGDRYPVEALGEPRVTGKYAASRFGEDWRSMAQADHRDDFLDRLKYLPINADGDIYLTLSGEARFRSDLLTNTRQVALPTERRDRLRLFGGADLHIGPHVRFYGELAHGGLSGINLTTRKTNFDNALVVQQAFVEVSGPVGGIELGARYGRQEFTDGSSLMIGTRDLNSIRFTVNGIRAWANGSKVRAGIFDFEFTDLGSKGLGDDPSDDGTRFSGVNLGFVVPERAFGGSRLFFDPFLWRLRQDDFRWGPSVAREERIYYGGRLWGSIGRLTVDWNVNHQSGSYGERDISAWSLFLAQRYRLGEARTAPSVGVRFDYGSGGGGMGGTGTLRTAETPYGNNSSFSYQIALTPTNLLAVTPGFSFQPFDRFKVDLEYQFSFRPVENDAVYAPINRPYAGTEAVAGHRVADMPRLQTRWTITPRVLLGTRTEYLIAREVFDRAGYVDSFFTTVWLSFRF